MQGPPGRSGNNGLPTMPSVGLTRALEDILASKSSANQSSSLGLDFDTINETAHPPNSRPSPQLNSSTKFQQEGLTSHEGGSTNWEQSQVPWNQQQRNFNRNTSAMSQEAPRSSQKQDYLGNQARRDQIMNSSQTLGKSKVIRSALTTRLSERALEHVDSGIADKEKFELFQAWLREVGTQPPGQHSNPPPGSSHTMHDLQPPKSALVSRMNSAAISVDNISQYSPSHADMKLRKRQEEQAARLPALLAAVPAKGILKNSGDGPVFGGGGGDRGPDMYQLPNVLPDHLTIKMPSLDSSKWENYVHAALYRVGRHFGFQAFNPNPKTADLASQEFVPATIFCASDHMCALLCKNNYIRCQPNSTDTDEMRFAKALHELHGTIFQPYEEQWTKLVDLSWRPQEQNDILESHSYYHPTVLHGLICELSLYILIYTEASSLRHTPELLWFLYWCMNHSYVMHELWKSGMPVVEADARTRSCDLRNEHQHLIHDVQAQLQLHPSRVRPEDCGRITSIISRLKEFPGVKEGDIYLLADLVAFGDGGFFCNRIVTPIFDVMAYEIDHLSNLGVDVAHRLGYDDFNESLCIKEIVHETLAELRVNPQCVERAIWNDSWVALTSLGFARGHAMGMFDAMVASEFWQSRVFVKTYRERRSVLALYRSYYRVFVSQLCLYQALQVIAFVGFKWRPLSSVFVTHSFMKAVERFANWFMTCEPREPNNTILSKYFASKGRFQTQSGLDEHQFHNQGMSDSEMAAASRLALAGKSSPIVGPGSNYAADRVLLQRRHHTIEGTPLYGIFGFVEWVLWFCFTCTWYVAQYYPSSIQQDLRDWWAVYSGCYLGLHFIHWCLTVRDGYMESLTHMLKLPKYFTIQSPRPRARSWISGKMHMKWKLWRLNNVFWITVFCMKLPFDYFVIAKPATKPLIYVQLRGWLACGGSSWYTYPFPCIGGDWVLQAMRVAPFIVIIYMDTALFYQLATTIFGMLRGLFKLDLGVLTSWSEIVTEFYRAPARWWHKCMSSTGNANQLAMVKQYMILEEMQSGYTGQVSDGQMFKQVVLTPEIINARKKQAAADALKLRNNLAQGSLTSMGKRPVGLGRKKRPNVIMAPKEEAEAEGTEGFEKGKAGRGLKGAVTNVNNARKAVQDFIENMGSKESETDPVAHLQKQMEALRKRAKSEAPTVQATPKGGKDRERVSPAPSSIGKSSAVTRKASSPGLGDLKKAKPHKSTKSHKIRFGGDPGEIKGLVSREPSAANALQAITSAGAASQQEPDHAERSGQTKSDARSTAGPVGESRMYQAPLPNSLLPQQAHQWRMQHAGMEPSSDAGEICPADDSTPTIPLGARMARSSSSSSRVLGSKGGPAQIVSQGRHMVDVPRGAGPVTESTGHFRHPAHEDDESSTISDSSSTAGERRHRQQVLEQAQAEFNQRSWRPSMMGFFAMFGTLWPNPPAEAAAPGPAALWWSIRNGRDPAASRPFAVEEGVEEEDEEEESDEAGSGEPSFDVLNAFREGMRRAHLHQDSALTPPLPPNVPFPPAPAPPPHLPPNLRATPDLKSFPSNDLSSRPSQGENPSQQAAWQALQARWSFNRGGNGRPLGEAGESLHTQLMQAMSSGHQASYSSDSSTIERNLANTIGHRLSVNSQDSQRLLNILEGLVGSGPADMHANSSSGSGSLRSSLQGSRQMDGSNTQGTGHNGLPHSANAVAAAGGNLPDQLATMLGLATSSATRQLPGNLIGHLQGILGEAAGADQDSLSTVSETSSEAVGHGSAMKVSATPNLEALQQQAAAKEQGRKGVKFHESNVYEGPRTGQEGSKDGWDIEAGGELKTSVGNKDVKRQDSWFGGLASKLGIWTSGNSIATNKKGRSARSRLGLNSNNVSRTGVPGRQFISRANSKAERKSALAQDLERTAAVASNRQNSTVSMGGKTTKKENNSELGKFNDPNGLGIDELHYQMMQWDAFAQAWDEVIDDLREADLVSNKEVGLLKFVKLDLGSRNCGLRPILLPTFFYAGQIRKVVDTGKVNTPQIMVLNELRVLCVWLGCNVGLLSGKHAHVISFAPFFPGHINVKHSLHRKKFYMAGLKLIQALEDICQKKEIPFDMRDIAGHMLAILTSLESEAFAISKAHSLGMATDEQLELSNVLLEVVQEMKLSLCLNPDELKIIIKTALSTTATANYNDLLRVVLVIKRMLITTIAESTPEAEEARRALGFFINSLAHPSLDRPPSMDMMGSWSILVPLYEEDVVYALRGDHLAKELKLKKKKMGDLLTAGDEGISVMEYLKTMLPKDWNNFKERMKMLIPDIDVQTLSEDDFTLGNWLYDFRMELQIWASCRGQLLARTVTGMMRNMKALQLLAKIEHPQPHNMTSGEYERWIRKLTINKFELVVTPQSYAKNRDSKDLRQTWLAKSIDLLLVRFPLCFKAAFLDQAEVEGLGKTEYSVCIRGRDASEVNHIPYMEEQPVYEIYRVRLPFNRYSTRGVIIGEGKPENQNHATIFAHHEGIQAIDMNQDGYMCEWLKMRNLLTELLPSNQAEYTSWCMDDNKFVFDSSLTAAEVHAIIRHRQNESINTALVGFREWIFSESAGALGRFAAATEYAFGTISQRTMTHPARVRLHYGHPDLFNKLYVMTKGGISKATRMLHLTEDVFCGCNHMLRGARIRYKEYISCGKGRDMGFDSINGYNFKIAGGGGEWAISRESHRMGTNLDYARLMAFYQSAVGFYVNSWLTFMAVYLNMYALLLYAWAQATEIQAKYVEHIYNVQQVLQLGTLALIPYAGQLVLENGLVRTCMELFGQLLTGSLVFYTFQQQTVAHSFLADLSYGSGKYVGTGRGFNIFSLEFIRIFMLYCRSHLYMSFELIFSLATLYIIRDCPTCNYGALTWSTWLLATTLIFAPLWFNPFSFDADKVRVNYEKWQRWMDGDVDPATGSNWYTWHNSMMEKARNDNGNNTDSWMNWIRAVFTTTPYWLMALGASTRIDICLDISQTQRWPVLCNPYIICLMGTLAICILVQTTLLLRSYWLDRANHKPWRIYRWAMMGLFVAFMVVYLVVFVMFVTGSPIITMILILYTDFMILICVYKISSVVLSQNRIFRSFSDNYHYAIDTGIGYCMFAIMGIMSFIGIVGAMQMKMLFNDSFSEKVKHAKISKGMEQVGYEVHKGKKPKQEPKEGNKGNSAQSYTDTTTPSFWAPASIIKSEKHYT